jgi:5-(carboxyamino)imidazole ribonucleotide mutase
MSKTKVTIFVGSDSDLPVIVETTKTLEEFGISFQLNIASAHRTPNRVRDLVRKAEKNGAMVMIACAGMSAALPGVIAAETTLPVIGVPMEGKNLAGLDSLLSIVQMPGGIPVATVSMGRSGALNAAILAAEIIALTDRSVKKKLEAHKKNLALSVIKKDDKLSRMGIKNYIESLKK